MRNFAGILLLLLSVPLQVSLTTLTGLRCDLSLVAIYFCGLYYGKAAGIGAGAGLGLFLDGLSLGPIGQRLISRACAGYLAAATGQRVHARTLPFHFVALVVLGSLTLTGEWFLASLTGQAVPGGMRTLWTAVPELLLTATVGVAAIAAGLRCGFAPDDLSYFPHR